MTAAPSVTHVTEILASSKYRLAIMSAKQKISANGTYVFDPEEIEQLDELSLTSVLSTMVDPAQEVPEAASPDVVAPARLGDTTINELLSDQLEPDDAPPAHLGLPVRPEPAEDPGDLIDPELLFPDLTTSKSGKGR
jgi:hypothetical protein